MSALEMMAAEMGLSVQEFRHRLMEGLIVLDQYGRLSFTCDPVNFKPVSS